jgi:hypothetical protein
MGYEFHITRALDWSESEQSPIAAAEWLQLVAADPELHIDEQNGPYFAVWSGTASDPEGGWFDWSDGCISTKNPDRAILTKMLELALKLRAKVQGDDGEIYTDASQLPDMTSPQAASVLKWHRRIEVWGPVLIVLTLGFLIFEAVRWCLR